MDSPAGSVALRRHLLSSEHIDALCAGFGDAAVVRVLWHTQRSRRLLLMHALLQTAQEHPELCGPLPPAASARRILETAQEHAAAGVDEILMHPQVGNWAAYALRRFRGGVPAQVPPWVDFGVIHVIGLMAAARAGLSWRTLVPARFGTVMLPGTGMARFTETSFCAPVEAWTEDGRIYLRHGDECVVVPVDPDRDAPGWWAQRRLRFGTGPVLAIVLDDVDPFRDLADPVPPRRLDERSLADWRARLAAAWELLCRHHPATADALAEAVVSVVPLADSDGWETRSASTGEAFGSVLVSLPPDPVTLAVCLVHEFQHIKLGGLMHLKALTREREARRYYAPWRDDPRPLGGLLQGIYAFVGIAAFWRAHRGTVHGMDATTAEFEYALARAQAAEGLRVAAGARGLTELGSQLIRTLSHRVEPWLDEPVPPLCADGAGLVAAAHRAGWRIRHLRPSAVEVDSLAAAFRAGQPARLRQYRTEPLPATPLRWSQGMLALVRAALAGREPRVSDRLRASGVDEADVALVRGEVDAARAGYRARLATDADDLNAWVGLGLADPGTPAGAALAERPELVLAVYRSLSGVWHAPEPRDLADWLGHALSDTPA